VPQILFRFVVCLVAGIALLGCAGTAAPSFDPSGACTSDGSAAGAYPDLESKVPARYRDASPESLDSGRNCSRDALGSLADLGYVELRFAGARWTFGGERGLVLAVFSSTGLQADQVADFYAASAKAASRTEVLAETRLTVNGRPARRLDTKTGERLQTVVTWPAADPDLVNVVVTNDLPDERITDAIDAFGDR
jgi:hypothetical protein